MPVRPLASHRARSAIYLLVLNQQTMAIPRSLAESLQENNIPPSGRRSPIGDGDTHRSRKQSGACLRLARISPQSRSAALASRAPTASTLPCLSLPRVDADGPPKGGEECCSSRCGATTVLAGRSAGETQAASTDPCSGAALGRVRALRAWRHASPAHPRPKPQDIGARYAALLRCSACCKGPIPKLSK